MRFYRHTLDTCDAVRGAAVVIDVLRAFTTAAYAFAGGAGEILLTREVEEAFALRRRFPGALIMGEVEGIQVAGFDFGNSPVEIQAADLRGRTLIQRTSHGTLGVALSARADPLLVTGFTTTGAVAAYLSHIGVEQVSFVVTGALHGEDFSRVPIAQGDEDAACADYLEALLRGGAPDPAPYLARVRRAPAANKFLDPEQANFSPLDLEACARLDVFDFCMTVTRQEGLPVLRPVRPDGSPHRR